MNEPDPLPPTLPSTSSGRPRGVSCFIKGCLATVTVLMFIGVGIGAFGWYLYKSGHAYFTEQQVPTRIASVSDEEFQTVLAKFQPFDQAVTEGHAATVELTADDLNTLIARLPQLSSLRGHAYVNILHDQLIADLSFPATEDGGPNQRFISARATLDASFAGGRFTFALRRVTPLQGEANDGLLPSILRSPTFLQNYSQMITRDVNSLSREQARQEPPLAALLAGVRTAVIQGDRIVVTSLERPGLSTPIPSPTVYPVASPAKSP